MGGIFVVVIDGIPVAGTGCQARHVAKTRDVVANSQRRGSAPSHFRGAGTCSLRARAMAVCAMFLSLP